MLDTHLAPHATCRRLCTGPAAEHIDDFADWLHRRGYRPNVLRSFAAWTDWLQSNGKSGIDFIDGLRACQSYISMCPGSFGSPTKDGVDGFLAVLSEVFDALDRLEAEPAQHCQCRVAQCGERLGCMTGVGASLVFPIGDIADVVQAVFDAPMFTRQGEQACGVGFICSQTGDGVDGFGGFFVTHDALARQAADLGQTTPGWCQVFGDTGGDLQETGLDPAVAFLDCLGLCEVRRRRPFRTGGNRARRPVQCPLSVPAGCP